MQTSRAPKRPIVLALLAAYLVVAALVAFWPTPVDQGAAPPLNSLITKLHHHGMPTWLGYDQLEFAANVVFFIPLGLLLTLLLGRDRWWLAVVIALCISACIELTQQDYLAARFASIADVAANGIGAILGTVVAVRLAGPRRSRTR